MTTTYKPRGRYDYTCDVTATIFGATDKAIVLFRDFECEVDIECSLSGDGFDLEARCTDVLIDGESLRNGDALTKVIRLKVMETADAELEAAGPLWDQVREAEGLSLTGHPNDPDTHWHQAW